MLILNCRLAELWIAQRVRDLTDEELDEMNMVLTANANYIQRMSALHELSYQASCVNDADWQHDICRQIEELERKHEVKHVFRPSKKSDTEGA